MSSFHFHTHDYIPGLYDLCYALGLQLDYKEDKPRKFAGGKWSPRAREIYNSLDPQWQQAFDDAWGVYEQMPESRAQNRYSRRAEVEDSIRASLGLPTWLDEAIADNAKEDKYEWEKDKTLQELEEENRNRYLTSPPSKYTGPSRVRDSDITLALDPNGEVIECPKCGYGLLEKDGKYGKFYGCSQFPSCWSTVDHPDNPSKGERPKKEKFEIRNGVVEDTYSYFTKRNGKKVKDRTPTEHSITIDGADYRIKTTGGRKHVHKGDTCSFTYTIDWRGESMVHKGTLKVFKKNGEGVKRR